MLGRRRKQSIFEQGIKEKRILNRRDSKQTYTRKSRITACVEWKELHIAIVLCPNFFAILHLLSGKQENAAHVRETFCPLYEQMSLCCRRLVRDSVNPEEITAHRFAQMWQKNHRKPKNEHKYCLFFVTCSLHINATAQQV